MLQELAKKITRNAKRKLSTGKKWCQHFAIKLNDCATKKNKNNNMRETKIPRICISICLPATTVRARNEIAWMPNARSYPPALMAARRDREKSPKPLKLLEILHIIVRQAEAGKKVAEVEKCNEVRRGWGVAVGCCKWFHLYKTCCCVDVCVCVILIADSLSKICVPTAC